MALYLDTEVLSQGNLLRPIFLHFFALQQREAKACDGVAMLQVHHETSQNLPKALFAKVEIFQLFLLSDAMQNRITMEKTTSSVPFSGIVGTSGQKVVPLSDLDKNSMSGHHTALPREHRRFPTKVCQICQFP